MTGHERLASRLQLHRERAGLSRRQAAEYLDCTGETIRRMEQARNKQAPNPRTVDYLLALYQVTGVEREQLMDLARALYFQRKARL